MPDAIQSLLIKVLLVIDSIVYSFINWLYQIIMTLAGVNIFSNTDVVDRLVNRIYIVIGVVMLFLIAYTLLKAMVNPDEALKSKQSPIKLIGKTIVSIVLIALIPTIFDFALGFQSALLKQNTLGSIIIGNDGSTAKANTIEDGGFYMSAGVLQAFLHPNPNRTDLCQDGILSEVKDSGDCDEVVVKDKLYSQFWSEVKEKRNFLMLTELSDAISGGVTGEGDLEYLFIISTICGAFVVLVLFSYCFDIALRSVKLALYQLIAPLPILARLLPNEQGDKVFKNWIKATLSTFAEIFIRLAILYFAVLAIQAIVGNWNIFLSVFSVMGNSILSLIALAILILGIVLFVKQAPEIIKEITGLDSGKYNIFGSAMDGFNKLRGLAKMPANAFNATEWDKNRPMRSLFNKFKNPLVDTAKMLTGTGAKDYKGIGDLNKNYKKSMEDVLNERRRKETIRRGNQAEANKRRQETENQRDSLVQAYSESDEALAIAKAVGISKDKLIDLLKSSSGDFKSKVNDIAHQKMVEVWDSTGDEDKGRKAYYDTYENLMHGLIGSDGIRHNGLKEMNDNVNKQTKEKAKELKNADRLNNLRYWATGGVENLKAKRDAISSVQRAAADVVSIAKKEVEGNLEKFYDASGTSLEMLDIGVQQAKANLQTASTDAEKRLAATELQTAQEALRKGIKYATESTINYTMNGLAGKTVNGINVEVVPGLSSAISKATNLANQYAGILEHKPNSSDYVDSETIKTVDNDGNVIDKAISKFDFKTFRNDLGSEVEAEDSKISAFMDIQNQKEGKK